MLVSLRYTYRDGGDNNLMGFDRLRESCRWSSVGEQGEEKMSLVRLKEENEEDRRLPPETSAMPKADAHSLTR